jgi:NADH dehydrogenase FAD-containing subunit
MPSSHNHLLLVGGGHAHVAVLADWIERGLPCEHTSLLTPHKTLRYSGMVPGWIAGQYERAKGTVDLAGLAKRAGAEFIEDRCIAIDPEARRIVTAGGRTLEFDVTSIDTGGVGRAEAVLGEDPRVLDIRPIAGFVEQLGVLPPDERIAVVGGGAGGTEIAFALRNRTGRATRPEIIFITGSPGLLPDMSRAVRERVRAELARQGIRTIEGDARFEHGSLCVEGLSLEPLDRVIAALGSAAPAWPGEGGLAVHEGGFIAVDANQRSISHPRVFAVGDVAARMDRDLPHSGVHAVFAGPLLAKNLRAVMAGHEPGDVYRPRWNNLYLMSTGNGSAIASYGPFAAKGRWVAKLKHWIDNRWISKYASLASGK